jgi:subtilisin family serine protease
VKRIWILIVSLLFFCSSAVANAPFSPDDYAPGEVLVTLEGPVGIFSETAAFESSLKESAQRLASTAAARDFSVFSTIASVSGKNIVHLKSDTKSTEQLLSELKDSPGVLAVVPNYRVYAIKTPNDTRYGELWGMQRINAPKAWDVTTGSKSIVVAVIDTGIDRNHPDLAANIVKDLDGRWGIDTYYGDWDPMDGNGHGTHVAGTIGAVGNNSRGVTGVNWQVGLLGVKVLSDTGSGS